MPNSRSRPARSGTGGDHLARRSAVLKRLQASGLAPSILIVEDRPTEATFIASPLRRLLGPTAKIEVAADIDQLTTALARDRYDLVFLDDRLADGQTAEATLPLIAARGARALIVVVSKFFTRTREVELGRLGADATIPKDDLDSVVLAEFILRLPEPKTAKKPV